jgi:hypothetical protein
VGVVGRARGEHCDRHRSGINIIIIYDTKRSKYYSSVVSLFDRDTVRT